VNEFKTLEGFVTGHESPGLTPKLAHYATLRVFSATGLDFGEIESALGLVASKTGRRGERVGPRSPANKGDIWMYQAPVAEERALGEHVEALWQALNPHVVFLRALKQRATVEIILGYSSNIDHAGVTIPHRSLEMFAALELDLGLNIVVVKDE
jgi:hypothetical protein